MSKGKFALGALFGAAVGVVAGILTAPKSGKETRADLKIKANQVADKASQTARDVRDRADSAVKDAKGTAESYADRVRRAAASAKAELDREDEKKK
jgi:gas vesicle protein